jgi:hypothetical protein
VELRAVPKDGGVQSGHEAEDPPRGANPHDGGQRRT